MNRTVYELEALFGNPSLSADDRLRFLAVLNLGLVEALERELVSVADAESLLYQGKNGYLVAEHCPGELAEDIMARGVQLRDLADLLAPEEATRELRRELNVLRHDSIALLREVQLRQSRGESAAAAAGSPAGNEKR